VLPMGDTRPEPRISEPVRARSRFPVETQEEST
jgi:hypothetical protein